MTDPRPKRFLLLFDRRTGFGRQGASGQLRLYRGKPSSPMGRYAERQDVMDAIFRALCASPELNLVPLDNWEPPEP